MNGVEQVERLAHLAAEHTSWCDPELCETGEWDSIHEVALAASDQATVSLQQHRLTDTPEVLNGPTQTYACLAIRGKEVSAEFSAEDLRDLVRVLAEAADRMDAVLS